jgi:redox-regulated HSP33 family molecular chaperone
MFLAEELIDNTFLIVQSRGAGPIEALVVEVQV